MLPGIQRRLAAFASAILIATSIAAPASAVARAAGASSASAASAPVGAASGSDSARGTETAARTHVDVAAAERQAREHPRAAHRPSPMRPVPHATRQGPRPASSSRRTGSASAAPLAAVVGLDVTITGGLVGAAVDVYAPGSTSPDLTCTAASCSLDISAYAGQTLRLVGRPPVGGSFVLWSGDCAGRDPCHLDASASRAVTGMFAPIQSGTMNLRVVDGQAGFRDTEFGCPIAPCFEPPDPVVAVSATQIVSATNESMRVRDRAGTLLADLPLWAFFAEPATTVIGGDPQVVWNPAHSRWIASEFSGDCQKGYLHVAVSDTANAAGGWLVYRFTRSSAFVDFPGLGISADKVVVSGNVFDISSVTCDAANFQAPVVYEMSLNTLLAGGSVTAAIVTMPDDTSTPRPAVVMDGTAALPVVLDTGDTGFGSTGIGYFVITGVGPSAHFGGIYDLSVPSNLPPDQFGTPLPAPVDPPRPAGFVASGDPVIDGRPLGVWVKGGDLWFTSNIACTPPTDGSSRSCARVTRAHLTAGWTATPTLGGSSPLADVWLTADSASGPLRFEFRWRSTPAINNARAEIHFGTPGASPHPIMFDLSSPPGSFLSPTDNTGGTLTSGDLMPSTQVPNMTAAIAAIAGGNAYVETYSDFGGPPANDSLIPLLATSVVDRSVFDDVIGTAGSDTFDAALGWATDGTIYLTATQSGGGSPIRTVATSAPAGGSDGTFAPFAAISRGQTTYGGTRWGDYQEIATDPADSHGVWASQEYVTSNTSWQAWVSHLSAGPSGAPAGTAVIDGGAAHTLDPIAVLDLRSTAGTKTTEARVSNSNATSGGGLLTAGRFVPLGHPTLWSLVDPAVGGTATTGPKHVYVQFGDGQGNWSGVSDHLITLDAHPSVTRFSGTDRYGTAAAISSGSFSPGAPVVFVATGAGFPDALAGAAVAGRIGAPVLLVTATTLPAATRTELARLKPDRIVILGGTGVVSNAVATALQPFAPGGVFRIAGANRYETAADIAFTYFIPGVDTAFIATGSNFPDALAGAAVAGKVGGPILLVSPSAIPSATAGALSYLQPNRIVILGGTGAVSAGVATALKAYTSGSVTRISGANRYATAAAISHAYFAPGVPAVFVATGTNFPDALAGAAVAGHLRVPVILVTPTAIPAPADAELGRLNPGRVVILGGTGAVSAAVAVQLATYIGP